MKGMMAVLLSAVLVLGIGIIGGSVNAQNVEESIVASRLQGNLVGCCTNCLANGCSMWMEFCSSCFDLSLNLCEIPIKLVCDIMCGFC